MCVYSYYKFHFKFGHPPAWEAGYAYVVQAEAITLNKQHVISSALPQLFLYGLAKNPYSYYCLFGP